MFARASTAAIAALCLVDVAAFAQSRSAEPTILFENVRIFDGKSDALSGSMNVRVRGNAIDKISRDPIPTDRRADARIIAGGGRTLMPGLIDMHWHTMLVRPTVATLLAGDVGYLNLMAGAEATDTLMRGFTTVRDVGGPAFGLKRAIDEGIVSGPRIYPSGAIITVTSGHGDFRQPFEVPRVLGAPQSRGEQTGTAMIADSPDEVRVRVREQLLLGATQIKLTAGGGVASPHSPLDASTFTEAELRAAVEAAENWGTYVTVHAYTPISIQRAIAAGVKCIEHGHLMDEPTAKLAAEKGIWLSTQAFPDEMADAFPPGSLEREKAFEVFSGTDRTFTLAKQFKTKTVRIAAAQTVEFREDIAAALSCVADVAARAEAEGASLLCFPEGFLQGYLTDETPARRHALDLASPVFEAVLNRFPNTGPMIVMGLIELDEGRLFNTAIVVDHRALIGRYRKVHLLGGERIFDAGSESPVFEVAGLRFGINICHDTNFPEAARKIADLGASLIVCPANNMCRRKTAETLRNVHNSVRSERCRETGLWLVSADVTGVRDERISWGPTVILNPAGEVVAQLPLEETGLLVFDIPCRMDAEVGGRDLCQAPTPLSLAAKCSRRT